MGMGRQKQVGATSLQSSDVTSGEAIPIQHIIFALRKPPVNLRDVRLSDLSCTLLSHQNVLKRGSGIQMGMGRQKQVGAPSGHQPFKPMVKPSGVTCTCDVNTAPGM